LKTELSVQGAAMKLQQIRKPEAAMDGAVSGEGEAI